MRRGQLVSGVKIGYDNEETVGVVDGNGVNGEIWVQTSTGDPVAGIGVSPGFLCIPVSS